MPIKQFKKLNPLVFWRVLFLKIKKEIED